MKRTLMLPIISQMHETQGAFIGLDPAMPDPDSVGGITVTGWAFDPHSSVDSVELSVGQGPWFSMAYGIERPDIVSRFERCDVGRPGFKASVHVIEDPITLQVRAVCADRRETVVRRTLQRSAAMNEQARGIYGAPSRFGASAFGLIGALLVHGRIGRDIWDSRCIRGWIRGKGEAEALATASASLPDSPVIVELGTFLGCSTVLLSGPCRRRRSGRVHCVDTFFASHDDGALRIYRAIADSLGKPMRQAFEENMRRAGVWDWITVYETTAELAAKDWNVPIDMLYLDADVSPEGSRRIFHAWSPFLRPGGVLAINGTVDRSFWTGSFEVVRDFVRPPLYEDVRRVDHITFARRTVTS